MSPMSSERHQRFANIGYLPGGRVADYLDKCKANYHSLYDRISLDRVLADRGLYQRIDSMSRTFEGSDKGGRGDSYRKTQMKYPLARAVGIKTLFELMAPTSGVPTSQQYVLDVLGGNGTLTRTMRLVTPPDRLPNIFTSDIAGSMVIAALAQCSDRAISQPASIYSWNAGGWRRGCRRKRGHRISPGRQGNTCYEGYSGGDARLVTNFRLAARLRERRPASRKDWVTILSPAETGRACIIPPDSPKTRSSTCAH